MATELFEKGRDKTGGRKAGTKNKQTVKMKETITKAFEELGGIDYLKQVGEDDPKTFLTLYGKLLPHELAGEINHTISLVDIIDGADEPEED